MAIISFNLLNNPVKFYSLWTLHPAPPPESHVDQLTVDYITHHR